MCLQMTDIDGCIFTLVTFVWLFSSVCFQMCPQIASLIGDKITQAANVGLFSTMGFQMCPQIVCPRRCKVGCICFAFLHYAFSNVSSNYLHVRMQNRTGSICSIFLPCGFSNDFGHFLSRKRQSHTGCTYLTFLHCLFLLLESARWLHLTCVVQDSDPSPA